VKFPGLLTSNSLASSSSSGDRPWAPSVGWRLWVPLVISASIGEIDVTFFVPVFWSLFIPLAAVLLWAIVDNVRDDARWRG
jgi:hypothetical protein